MMADVLEVRTGIGMGMFMGARNRPTLHLPPSSWCTKLGTKRNAAIIASSCSAEGRTLGVQVLQRKHEAKKDDANNIMKNKKQKKKERVFFLDVNPISYKGSTPSLHSFAHWISLFFSQVSLTDPVIAVFDGEGAHEHRRRILPSYKAHRRKFSPWISASREAAKSPVGRSHRLISDILTRCNVPNWNIEIQESVKND
ncbi:hypothetical protein L1987_64382 [Smallanthus sonchifolius]|uniref:Uncharacterized protein n=1 Tax=Smallanthus sonchifolius TaxID=185202 RepID=A0ACB9CFV6_9ASTR|nr:hypothetical protein L1987_64382 [Smallanthus sonchifolius]